MSLENTRHILFVRVPYSDSGGPVQDRIYCEADYCESDYVE